MAKKFSVDYGRRLSEEEQKARAEANPRVRGRRVKDLTGMVFNDLTVIGRADDYINPKGSRFVQWECRCVCGNTCVKRGTALTSGKAKSCGCARSRSNKGRGLIDLSGMRFGRWRVLERAEDKVDGQGKHWPMWLCECDCGTRGVISGASLRAGTSKSCGCLKKDVLTKDRNLVGTRYGRLLVTGFAGHEMRRDGAGVVRTWACRCDCGNELVLPEPPLVGGSIHSCGCLKRSYNEDCFRKVLEGMGVSFSVEKTYVDLRSDVGGVLRYDFCLDAGHEVLVELHGEQHYRPIDYFGGRQVFEACRQSDEMKRQYADSHGIPLYVMNCSDTPSMRDFANFLEQIADTEGIVPMCSADAFMASLNKADSGLTKVPKAEKVTYLRNLASPISEELCDQLVDKSFASLTAHSHRKVEWRCERGHTWSATVASRTAGAGCPYCSGRFAVKGENDLATLRPDLAAELVRPEEAETVTVGSGKKLEWRCTKDPTHTWFASPRSRIGSVAKAGTGCPHCSGHAKRRNEKAKSEVAKRAVSSTPASKVARGKAKDAAVPSLDAVIERLRSLFLDDAIERVDGFSSVCAHVPSRGLYVGFLPGHGHGWHWLGEMDVSSDAPSVRDQMAKDAELREFMRASDANFVVFWDPKLWDMDLWVAMGMPDARDWERSYSWLSAKSLEPVKYRGSWSRVSNFSMVAKHYQHDVFFASELALWSDDSFLGRRSDRRRLIGMFFANRYHYLGKLPDDLTSAEVLRGLTIANVVHGYSRYDARCLDFFLETHPDVHSVIDPCAGWGERMLCCAVHDVSYDGVDINAGLEPGYRDMISELDLKNVSFSVDDGAKHAFASADAMIACPPYHATEHYTDEGAENLSANDFVAWWSEVVDRAVEADVRYLCLTTNQACQELFLDGLSGHGFRLLSSAAFGRGHASHFNRKGGTNSKQEYEEFMVFERI